MNTTDTAPRTAGQAIRSYMDRKDIRYRRLVNGLGLRKDVVSRMLADLARSPSERLSAERVHQIAVILDVPRAVEAEWLALLDQREPVAV